MTSKLKLTRFKLLYRVINNTNISTEIIDNIIIGTVLIIFCNLIFEDGPNTPTSSHYRNDNNIV